MALEAVIPEAALRNGDYESPVLGLDGVRLVQDLGERDMDDGALALGGGVGERGADVELRLVR